MHLYEIKMAGLINLLNNKLLSSTVAEILFSILIMLNSSIFLN
jgi:hypothetical protein